MTGRTSQLVSARLVCSDRPVTRSETAASKADKNSQSEALSPSPTGKTRKQLVRLFGILFTIQMLIPLTYYLRDDPYDERFAWRMFSAVRLHSCQTSAAEDHGEGLADVRLSQLVHRAWINHLERNRRDVVLAYLSRRCEEEDVRQVVVTNRCRDESGQALNPQVYERSCGSGEVTFPDALIQRSGDEIRP